MIHSLLGAMCFAALRPGHDYRPALDELVELEYTACRVAAGRLAWCGQEPERALERLPPFLDEAHARGLNVEVTALTDTAREDPDPAHPGKTIRSRAFDPRPHVAAIGPLLSPFDMLEYGNEPWHATQWDLTPGYLASLPRPPGVLVAFGASSSDEATDYAGGDYVTAHLDRGRDKWNQVRRVRELHGLSAITGRPVLNNEPIGADEVSAAGKRESDPAFFFTLGALNRLFLGGSGIFHSQAGLMAERLGPNQRACARAFVAGARIWPGAHRLTYVNVGQGGPIAAARFNDGRDAPGCTRSYSGVDGAEALNVTLGIVGDPGLTYGNGWHPRDELGAWPGVVARRLTTR